MRLFKARENTYTTKWQPITLHGERIKVQATVKFSDDCGNGHNTLSVTGETQTPVGRSLSFGCCHEEIIAAFPRLEGLINYHLCSSDGPMHYVANTIYHAKEIPEKQDQWWFRLEGKVIKIVSLAERDAMIEKYGDNAVFEDYPNSMAKGSDIDAARSCAIWPDAALEQLLSESALADHLPTIMDGLRLELDKVGLLFGDEPEQAIAS